MTKETPETVACLQRFLVPIQKPGRVNTDHTKEFVKACQAVQLNHDTSTLHRSETNGVAERARAESETRNFDRTCPKWSTRSKVGLCDVLLLLPTKLARQIGR